MTLEAGDVITTGTPPGVGLGMKPPQYLKAGDVVELTIEGLGRQKQICVNA
jgi:2-keto-4-pentenoate hydratase/2-oxohepta-3-ene-1,7-dioic acid hydratase in catechol pathway